MKERRISNWIITIHAEALLVISLPAANFERIKSFGFADRVEQTPEAGLVQGADGWLYGTSAGAGTAQNAGTIFKVQPDGSSYAILYRFHMGNGDGQTPEAALIQASDGALYGTTMAGGARNAGTIFTLGTDGSGYRILHNFGSVAGDGQQPVAPLFEGSDGALYGTTQVGGTTNGTIFKINKDGGSYTVLHRFGGPNGEGGFPVGGVIEASDGNLYGTTSGSLFLFGSTYGYYPGTVFAIHKNGSGYQTLHVFGGGSSDGALPSAGLIEASDGMLYGTTREGGFSFINRDYGSGIVFKLQKDGSGFALLASFGTSQLEGINPLAPLVEGTDGKLYGTTTVDGLETGVWPTVFSINKDGSAPALVKHLDANPRCGLIQGQDGALYGTTDAGGGGFGTVFRLTTDGQNLTVLHSFVGPTGGDLSNPGGALVEVEDGSLYGATVGNSMLGDVYSGSGALFKVDKDASNYQVLEVFGSFGAQKLVPIAGRLYGTENVGWGAVFGVSESGTGFTDLHLVIDLPAESNAGRCPGGTPENSPTLQLWVSTLRATPESRKPSEARGLSRLGRRLYSPRTGQRGELARFC